MPICLLLLFVGCFFSLGGKCSSLANRAVPPPTHYYLPPTIALTDTLVCAVLDGTQQLDTTDLCAGSSPQLVVGGVVSNSYAGAYVAWRYHTTADFNPYTTGTDYVGQPLTATTCEPTQYYFKAFVQGAVSCTDVSPSFAVAVYPPLVAHTTNGINCLSASVEGLSVECGVDISWSDTDGNLGVGQTYSPLLGSIGTVTFTLLQPNAPAACASNVFAASYNCSDLECSRLDSTQAVLQTATCSGMPITFQNGGVINNDFAGGFVTWVYSIYPTFNAYTNATEFGGLLPSNQGCSAVTYYVCARLDGVIGCNNQSAAVPVLVYPQLANKVSLSSTECSASVQTVCDNLLVSSLFNGTITVGNTLTVGAGEAGSAVFSISDPQTLGLSCNSLNLVAELNCPNPDLCDNGLPAITVFANVSINSDSGTYTALYYALGGLPSVEDSPYTFAFTDSNGLQYDTTLYYNTLGSLSAEYTAETNFTLYITATDNAQCSATIAVPIFNTLPVKWLQVAATPTEQGNRIDWRTASETNNDFFVVERSTQPTNGFVSLATIASHQHNSHTIQQYSYTDTQPPHAQQWCYYRVAQTDLDGTTTYSRVLTIAPHSSKLLDAMPYPVPATDYLYLPAYLLPAHARYGIYNTVGAAMPVSPIVTNTSTNSQATQQLAVANYPSGIYWLWISSDNGEIKRFCFIKK